MLQGQKYEFVRKPRKLLSRDKQSGIASHHSNNRQISRDSLQKKIVPENSPNKSHQLISNLRFQLTNLRQQVSKLSKKQNKKSIPINESTLQYDLKSPRQKKNINSYYFEDVKSTIPQELAENPLRPSDQKVLERQDFRRSAQVQKLKLQIGQFQTKNSELVKVNEQLNEKMKENSERIKRQYELKIYQLEKQKQRSSNKRQNKENDRTITFQKQLLENKHIMQELRINNSILNRENQDLKAEIEKYISELKIKREIQIKWLQNEQSMQDMIRKIKSLQDNIQDMKMSNQQQLKKYQMQKQILNNHILELNDCIKDMKSKLDLSQKRNIEMDKKNMELSQKIMNDQQLKRKVKPNKTDNLQIRELKEIIGLHQKSLMNQQSDLNYLEGEVRKLSFFKQISRKQALTIQQMNEEMLELNLKHLNQKYHA